MAEQKAQATCQFIVSLVQSNGTMPAGDELYEKYQKAQSEVRDIIYLNAFLFS
jgi:hypothetical protein